MADTIRMPSVSIYLPDELDKRGLDEVDVVDRDGNFSPRMHHVIRGELDGDYDTMKALTESVTTLTQSMDALQHRLDQMENWKEEVITWFTAEMRPAESH